MNCESEVAEFTFSEEQSKEFAAITHEFLNKHFSDKKLPVKIEIEVRFRPRFVELSNNQASIIYGCIAGEPQSPYCDDNEGWGPIKF